MKSPVFAAIILLGLSGTVSAGPHLAAAKENALTPLAERAQLSRAGSQSFRQCMRAKYGPRYFYRVRQAQRYFMAQACGG